MSLAGYRHRDTCRLCASAQLELVLPLAPSALADDYVSAERLGEPQPAYPLDVHMCRDCGHVQLVDVIDPEILFGNYIYTSSSSPGLVEHFAHYADDVAGLLNPCPGALAVDIGSNDGLLLGFLANRGLRVVGIDPAHEIASRATASGIPTVVGTFGLATAEAILAEHGSASLVTANNVYAHADDLADVTDGIRALLSDDGVFVFEVSYLQDLIENFVFDSIYHEHLCYHSVGPLRRFLAAHGLELFDVQSIGTKGGSLRGFAQLSGGPRRVEASVEAYVEQERQAGLDRTETLHAYAQRIATLREQVREILAEEQRRGSTIVGFGASATSTTLIHHFGLQEFITAIVDERPSRQGLFSPGHHLPVIGPESLAGQDRPDLVVLLAWRFAGPIADKHGHYLERGGRFLVPVPEAKLLAP